MRWCWCSAGRKWRWKLPPSPYAVCELRCWNEGCWDAGMLCGWDHVFSHFRSYVRDSPGPHWVLFNLMPRCYRGELLRLMRLVCFAALMFADCQHKMREGRAFHRLNFIRMRLLQPLRVPCTQCTLTLQISRRGRVDASIYWIELMCCHCKVPAICLDEFRLASMLFSPPPARPTTQRTTIPATMHQSSLSFICFFCDGRVEQTPSYLTTSEYLVEAEAVPGLWQLIILSLTPRCIDLAPLM